MRKKERENKLKYAVGEGRKIRQVPCAWPRWNRGPVSVALTQSKRFQLLLYHSLRYFPLLKREFLLNNIEKNILVVKSIKLSWNDYTTGKTTDNWGSIPGRDKTLPLLHSVQTSSGVHPTSYSTSIPARLFPRGQSGRAVMLTTHLHIVPWLTMGELYLHSTVRLQGVVLN
jgi:hypothetical protein